MTNTQRNQRDNSYVVDFDAIDARIDAIDRTYIARDEYERVREYNAIAHAIVRDAIAHAYTNAIDVRA